MKHQVQVPDDVWAWAQTQTGQVRPATFLRDILVRAMYGGGAVAAQQQSNVLPKEIAAQPDLVERWRAIGLGRDPGDSRYMQYRATWIAAFDSELEALESAERKYASGYDEDEDGNKCVNNMRGYLVYLVKKMENAS